MVPFRLQYEGKPDIDLESPLDFPKDNSFTAVQEPTVNCTIITPEAHVGDVLQLCSSRRGDLLEHTYLAADRCIVRYQVRHRRGYKGRRVLCDVLASVLSVTESAGCLLLEATVVVLRLARTQRVRKQVTLSACSSRWRSSPATSTTRSSRAPLGLPRSTMRKAPTGPPIWCG